MATLSNIYTGDDDATPWGDACSWCGETSCECQVPRYLVAYRGGDVDEFDTFAEALKAWTGNGGSRVWRNDATADDNGQHLDGLDAAEREDARRMQLTIDAEREGPW